HAAGRSRRVGLPRGAGSRVRAVLVARDYLPAEKPLADTGGLAPLTLDFELVRGVRVKGRVTDRQTGKPVVAALWYFPLADNKLFKDLPGNDFYRNSSIGMRTKEDGTYSLVVLPGSGILKLGAEVEATPYTEVVPAPPPRKRAYREEDPGLGPSFLSAGGGIETLRGHNAYRLIEPAPGTETLACDAQ